MVKVRWVVVVVVLGLASDTVAVAAPRRADTSEDDQRAKQFYEDGTRAFNLGEFASAIELYRRAYKHKPDPGLLYNIAQSYRLANDATNAVFFYRSFLRAAPNTPNRKEVENRITTLEVHVVEQKATPSATIALGALPTTEESSETAAAAPRPSEVATQTQTQTQTPAPESTASLTAVVTPRPVEKPLHKRWWLWTVVGVAAVGLGLGLGLGIGLQDRAPSAHFGTRQAF